MQLRHMEIVQDEDKLKVDIQQVCMEYKTIKQWAYILHDKDDTRPHYHIYINFGKSSVDTKLVASWFKLGYVNDKGEECTGENFINKVKGRKVDMLQYLIHANDSQQYKHRYDPKEVVSNFDFGNEILNSKIIGDFDTYSYAQQLKYVDSLPVDEKGKEFTRLKKLWELRCQTLVLNPDRKIDVIFIVGKGGAGKTYYAKKLCEQMNIDFCVSSASNDPFQDYAGQKAIILDDLRDKSFELEDLLKILDNNTNSSVKSRFANKVFNGQVIIITTPVPLKYWYSVQKFSAGGVRNDYNGFDGLEQLYRRITLYVTIDSDYITLYQNIDSNGNPINRKATYNNDLIKSIKEAKPDKTDFKAVFDKFLSKSDKIGAEQTALNLVAVQDQSQLPF